MLLGEGPGSEAPAPDRLIRLPEVMEITGLKKSTIYRMLKDGVFPPPGKLGTRFTTWKETAIRAWVDARVPHTP
ncbi:hypothetical protein RD110_07865 [Rhodoferax koreense]|uniref:Uncharacterized protein n=2 Tax=Rhodoferax koreensis TaxID=1842727 RepID=A0A1P8K3H6_9BURK|nr:hypothetical protein RD110_07865 [Rhodoferax koreense]